MAQGLEGLLTGHTLVKRYRIEEVCGRGGFAVVYRATDTRLGRPVAVKVITLTAEDPEHREVMRERLHKEARAAASLPHHPNLVTVHDVGTDPQLGLDFLVMELLQGENLSQALQRGRPPLPRALRILRDAAEGLAVGHRAGLVHRDVKPGNIFLAAPHDGGDPDAFRVCLLDYGIAQAIEDDQTVTRGMGGNPLSPAFASPEQLRGDRDLSPATDVFSLGVVGYQLLTGERPFASEPGQVPTGWTVRTPLRELAPEVGAGVEAVVMRAMSVDPNDRFVDADAFVDALDAATGEEAEQTLVARAHRPGIGALPLDDEIGVVDEDDRTMIAPAAPVAAAAAPAAAPHRPIPPLRPAHPAPRKKASKLPLVLVVALLLVAAAAYAALRGRGGADQATVTPGAADDTTTAGSAGTALDDGDTEGVPALPSRTGVDVDVPVAGDEDGDDGDEPAGGAPSASRPATTTPNAPTERGQVPAPRPREPQQPTVNQPRPPTASPPAQQPSLPPAQERPPAAQPAPQEPQPQPRPEPPLLGRPVEPQPPPAVTPAPNPNAPRDTIRIGNPR
jgi:hypothetical protein